MTGVKAEHIPYKGTGPALIDLIGGQYQFNFAGMQAAQVHGAGRQAARDRGHDAQACGARCPTFRRWRKRCRGSKSSAGTA